MADGTFLTALGTEAYEGFGRIEDTNPSQVNATLIAWRLHAHPGHRYGSQQNIVFEKLSQLVSSRVCCCRVQTTVLLQKKREIQVGAGFPCSSHMASVLESVAEWR